MTLNSHPEPSPVWIFGWPWENEPWWKYEIVDNTVDDDDDDDDFGDDSEDVTCPTSEVHWQEVVKVFEPLHHINNDTARGVDPFEQFLTTLEEDMRQAPAPSTNRFNVTPTIV